jgi:hypothetical protein
MSKIKPIYKFNNGNGAMLCNKCSTIISTGKKTEQLYCDKCNPDKSVSIDDEFKYKLVREKDGLVKQSKEIKWIEFDENGRFKADYQEPEVGRSLIMSPFNASFTWQTTLVTEITEETQESIKFKTENSNYELFIL